MATFGNSGWASGSKWWVAAGTAMVCRFQAPANGTITQMDMNLVDNVGDWTACVYSDNAGAPDALLATGAGAAIGDSDAINCAITSGTWYHIGGIIELMMNVHYVAGVAGQANRDGGLTYPNLNDPFDVDETQAREIEVYATYTPSAGVSVPVLMNQYGTHINKKIRGG